MFIVKPYIQNRRRSENAYHRKQITVPQPFITRQLQTACPLQQAIPLLPELDQMQTRRKKLYEKALTQSKNCPAVTVDLTSWQAETANYSQASPMPVCPSGDSANLTWSDVLTGKVDVESFASTLTDDELARLACGSTSDNVGLGSIIGSASVKVAGAAGETTRNLIASKGIPSIVLADGPAGVRICPVYTLEGEQVKPAAMSFGGGMTAFLQPEEIAVMRTAMGVVDITDRCNTYYQYCTAIPIGTAIAQSFKPALAQSCGDIVGSEMELFGVLLWLAPALNIQRSLLCGRNFEYYSEDPWVSGTTAAALTSGVQKRPGCGVTIKHFACNNQETNRYRSNSIVSERAMREIYLRGFEICVRTAKPASVMTSYNLINGEHACNSRDLLTHILRNEWGFEGIVMTDWFVTSAEINAEKESIHPEASAAGCVKAGNNLIMPGLASDIADIHSALKESTHRYCLNRSTLIQNAVQMLRCIQAFS